MKNNDFIREHGLFTSLIVSMIGIGVFYGPSSLAKIVGRDGWISALIMGGVLFLLLYMINHLMKLNDYKDIVTILNNTYGRILGNIISLVYAIVMIYILSISLRTFADVINMYLLQKTPRGFIIVIMIFIGVYLVRGGLTNIVHFNEITFWIMVIPTIFILLLNIPNSNFTMLLPMLRERPISYVKGVLDILFLVNGFCIAFVLLPHVKRKESITKIFRSSSIFIALFYAITFIFVISTLSAEQTAERVFPTITMLKSINTRSGVLERWDGLVMALWILFYFTNFCNTYYFSSYIVKKVLNLEHIRISSILFIPVIYIAALYPENMIEIRSGDISMSKMIFIISIIVVIIISYLISLLKKKRSIENES